MYLVENMTFLIFFSFFLTKIRNQRFWKIVTADCTWKLVFAATAGSKSQTFFFITNQINILFEFKRLENIDSQNLYMNTNFQSSNIIMEEEAFNTQLDRHTISLWFGFQSRSSFWSCQETPSTNDFICFSMDAYVPVLLSLQAVLCFSVLYFLVTPTWVLINVNRISEIIVFLVILSEIALVFGGYFISILYLNWEMLIAYS